MSLIASASSNVKIWLFDGTRIDILANSTPSQEKALCVRWNHTNQVVGASTSEGTIRLHHVNTAQVLSTLSLQESNLSGGPVRSIAFSSNSRYLASSCMEIVHLWDLKRRNIKISLTGHAAEINTLGFAPDGQVVSGDMMGVLRVWDINNSSSVELKRPGSAAPARCLELSVLGHAACGYGDGGLALWDLASTRILSQSATLHSSPVVSLAISPKNPRLVITAGEDGKVNLFDTMSARNGAASASINAGEQLTSISFQENAIHSAVGTAGGNILIYDWRQLSQPLCKIPAHNPHPVLSLAFQVPKLKAVTGGSDSLSSVSPSVDVKSAKDRITTSFAASRITPTKSLNNNNISQTAFPDPGLREQISDLSVTSAGSVSRAASRLVVPPVDIAKVDAKPVPTPERSALNETRNSRHRDPTSNSSVNSPQESRREGIVSHVSRINAVIEADDDDRSFSDLKRQVQPVTSQELQETYQLLRYDVHREVQSVIREQVRQFEISKEETNKMILDLKQMLSDVLQANKELREENERLRRIY